MHVDNPVHEIEANETDWENHARVFVDIGRRETVKLVQILSGWQNHGAVFFVASRTVNHVEIVAGTGLVHGYTSSVGLHHEANLLKKREKIRNASEKKLNAPVSDFEWIWKTDRLAWS